MTRPGPGAGAGGGLNEPRHPWGELQAAYRGATGARAPRKLWLSEFTVQSDAFLGLSVLCLAGGAGEGRLHPSFDLARSLPYVEGMGWFLALRLPPGANLRLTWGLMTYSGERKPAYQSLKNPPLKAAVPEGRHLLGSQSAQLPCRLCSPFR